LGHLFMAVLTGHIQRCGSFLHAWINNHVQDHTNYYYHMAVENFAMMLHAMNLILPI
jgi:hypothetical protein